MAATQAELPGEDPFLWLEETRSERAMAWVQAENERTLAELTADPRYLAHYDAALAILEASDRIPFVSFHPDGLHNFWQDATHVRGIVRRTSMESYRSDAPAWETLLDIDALAAAEGKSWVYQGMDCLPPQERRCLVRLSEGGGDAAVVREYDLAERQFVAGGFSLPPGKQSAQWIDADTLLVAREWGQGTLTESGYPFVVKRLRRGQPLEAAEELYRGRASDTLSLIHI